MGERSERPFRRLHLDVVASWDGSFSSEHDNTYEGRHASIIQTLVTIIKLLVCSGILYFVWALKLLNVRHFECFISNTDATCTLCGVKDNTNTEEYIYTDHNLCQVDQSKMGELP
jgi:hypothetical protein